MIARTFRFDVPAGLISTRHGNTAEAREDRQWAADTLRANPGQWALLGRWHNSPATRQHAHAIRQGDAGWQMFGPGFEVEAHTMLGEHRIYARFADTNGGAS